MDLSEVGMSEGDEGPYVFPLLSELSCSVEALNSDWGIWPIFGMSFEVVAIDEWDIGSLVFAVECFEHFISKKLVTSVYGYDNVLRVAGVVNGFIEGLDSAIGLF